MIPSHEEPGYGGIELSKADKMLKEIGYEKKVEYSFVKEYDDEYGKYIFLNPSDKSWDIYCELEGDNTIEEHIALHEKLKELGWLNEQSI